MVCAGDTLMNVIEIFENETNAEFIERAVDKRNQFQFDLGLSQREIFQQSVNSQAVTDNVDKNNRL